MMTSSNGNIFRVIGHLCGEFTGPGEFPTQRPVTRSFDVFFDQRLNKRLSKQPWGWWFETPSWSLWRQCNVVYIIQWVLISHGLNNTQTQTVMPPTLWVRMWYGLVHHSILNTLSYDFIRIYISLTIQNNAWLCYQKGINLSGLNVWKWNS